METVGVDVKFDGAWKIVRPSRIGSSRRWKGVDVPKRAAGEYGVASRYCADERTAEHQEILVTANLCQFLCIKNL
jgi:hypothetical protein